MEPPLISAESGRFLEAIDDVFLVLNPSGRVRDWNEAAIEVTGFSPEEVGDMRAADFFVAADEARISEALRRVLSDGEAVVEADLRTAAGDRIPYEFKARHVEISEHGEVIIGIGRDISARRAAAQERQEILDRMSDAFFAVDEHWEITYVNEQGKSLLRAAAGTDLDTFVGRNVWETVPDAVGTTFHERYQEAMEAQEPRSFEAHYEPLDTWFDVRVHPSASGLSIYLSDITERIEHREATERRQQVLREMYEIISDRGRSFEGQVSALLELGRVELNMPYGTLSEIEGEDYIFEIVSADDDSIEAGDVVPLSATNCELAAAEQQTLVLGDVARDAPAETDRTGYTDWGISCYIGSPVMVNEGVYGTFCFYDTEPLAGQFSAWEVTLVDLMSRWVSYELQRQATTAELERQNKKLEEFAGIVSHDLRNPLNTLEGYLELAETVGDPEHFEASYDALERMHTLIDDLLALAQAGEMIDELESVDIHAVAERCWDGISIQEATLDIQTEQMIRADEPRLQQLLENLLRNAVEHGGSDVTVRIGDIPGGFYVEDTGPGIPADVRGDVFEGGYTTANGGTGFGLAIVEDIAEAHGWSVELTQAADGGARFEFAGLTAVD